MVSNRKYGILDIINTIFLVLIGLSTLYPFVNLLFISFSSMQEVMQNSFMLYPKSINLDAYQYVLKFGRLGNAYKITLFITLVGTLLNLTMTSFGAYTLSIRNIPGRNLMTTFVVITMIFQAGLIPSYMVIKNLKLIDTIWVLIIPNAINTFWMILMRNFFQSIPDSLRESARIDGYSEYSILFKIILPLSMPIIATLSLFYGVAHWNEYYLAIIYTNKQSLHPLQVVIRKMFINSLDNLSSDALPPPVETVRAATIILTSIPILCLYPFLQKYFAQGVMVGAIKA